MNVMAELGDLVLKRIKIVSKIEKITITTFSQHFQNNLENYL